jgi:hypothetical protein
MNVLSWHLSGGIEQDHKNVVTIAIIPAKLDRVHRLLSIALVMQKNHIYLWFVWGRCGCILGCSSIGTVFMSEEGEIDMLETSANMRI